MSLGFAAMSVSRGSIQELCDAIEAKPAVILGNKFFDTRLVVHIEFSSKGTDKFEWRFLVISKFRVFLLTGKNANSLKIDKSFHILQIKSICVINENETAVVLEDGGTKRRTLFRSFPSQELTLSLLKTLRHYFSDIVPLLPRVVELHPPELYKKAEAAVVEVSPRPCHSFRRTYAALCDLHDQPYRDEVAWDVEKIYTTNCIRDLRLDDFSHLHPKDLIPIVASLQYSSYFEGLIVDGARLSAEMVDVVVSVVRYSISLKRLVLSNCGLTREFPGVLASALSDNESIPLEAIDLSKNNTLDDRKGIASLCTSLSRLPSLSALSLAECSLSEKSSQNLASSLYSTLSSSSTTAKLTHLNLACNHMKEDTSSLVNLLSLSISLRTLDLSDCLVPLDKLWPALKYGCLQLERLIVSGCVCTHGKKTAPESITAAKDFFAASVSLNYVDMSRIPLTCDLLRAVLSGLSNNNQLEPFTLILDGSCEKQGTVLEEMLPYLRASSLSLRDCHLEADFPGVIQSIARMPCLQSLSLGGTNVVGLKRNAKHSHLIGKSVSELVKLITNSNTLESLSLSDAHLGSHVSLLINSLGACNVLKTLDLSANDLSNFGARILSKALAVNCSLRSLSIDANHTTADGLSDLASSLDHNLSLTSLPCPFNDIAEAIQRGERAKVSYAWQRIESSLERNRSGKRVMDAAIRRAGGRRGKEQIMNGGGGPPTEHIVQQFVQKVREECGDWVKDRVGKKEWKDEDNKMERSTFDALKENIGREVNNALTEWCWREMCTVREGAKGRVTVASGDKSCHHGIATRSGTPLSDCASPSPVCRPRSILTEQYTPHSENDSLMDVLGPPKPSSLTHLNKARPKPLRRRIAQGPPPQPVLDEENERTSSPTDSAGSSCIENRPERVSSPRAMLPPMDAWSGGSGATDHSPCPSPSSLTNTQQSNSFSMSNSLLDSPPPPLPKRSIATPPSLPPKPDKMAPPRETSRDESPASSRRSVADMARLFNR